MATDLRGFDGSSYKDHYHYKQWRHKAQRKKENTSNSTQTLGGAILKIGSRVFAWAIIWFDKYAIIEGAENWILGWNPE